MRHGKNSEFFLNSPLLPSRLTKGRCTQHQSGGPWLANVALIEQDVALLLLEVHQLAAKSKHQFVVEELFHVLEDLEGRKHFPDGMTFAKRKIKSDRQIAFNFMAKMKLNVARYS